MMRRIVGSATLAVIVVTGNAFAQQAAQPGSTTPRDPPRADAPAQEQARTSTLLERISAPRPASSDALPRWRIQDEKSASRPLLQPSLPALRGESVALMVAGGALFVAGIITGDGAGALLMVGGAVVGAYGLYLHYR